MASRYRTISRPAISLLKSSMSKPSTPPVFLVRSSRSSPPNFSRPMPQMAALQSLLPLHMAVSSARLASSLAADIDIRRFLSRGVLCNADPGG